MYLPHCWQWRSTPPKNELRLWSRFILGRRRRSFALAGA